ncbi:MAG: YwqG family protein [Pirellulales bacterium]|nr:YwqG family protein [Pirellulales bacterium]
MRPHIQKLITDVGLERAATQLLDAALPAIGISGKKVLSPCRIGSSKIGGRPSLPITFEWPTHKGRKLDFLLQINLADVAPLDVQKLLPASGLLSFFYDLDSQPWGYDPADLGGFKVIHTTEMLMLSEHEIPNPDFPMPECELTFHSVLTLPHFGSRAAYKFIESVGLSEADYNAYSELTSKVEKLSHTVDGMGNHHLLGHSANVQGDMQLEAQLVTNGLNCGNSRGYEDPRRKILEAGAEEWLLLLQLDSDDVNGFMWGDCGMLYYWIRRDDLMNQQFENVWMSLQCY